MSATKLCFFLGAANSVMLLRTPNNSLSSLSLLRFTTKPLFLQTLHHHHPHPPRRHVCSASATAEAAIEIPATTSQDHHYHPWPEWVTFIDHLKSKGYFARTSSSSTSSSSGGAGEVAYDEMNLLKDPCLSFARDRYDIFGSLPKGDLQIIVEGGCPKLHRKVVNSAKRLRLYVGLDEKNVCSACSLRGSCDRAYVMLKESEGDARTVDIMRLLLFYALDPSVTSEAVRPPGIEQAESCARRLLSMFVDLSEASPVLPPVEPSKTTSSQKRQSVKSSQEPFRTAVEPSKTAFAWKKQSFKSMDPVLSRNIESQRKDWRCSKCDFVNFSRNVECRQCKAEGPKQGRAHDTELKRGGHAHDIETKRGDWNCPQCNFVNFSRNVECRQCKAEGPKQGRVYDTEMRKGDWNCPQCNFVNFSRNVECRQCKAEGPKQGRVHDTEKKRRGRAHDTEMKRGDWNCPECGCMNFANRKDCFECKEPRPARFLEPGEWECPKCDYLNFRRNITCLKCASKPAEEAVSQYEEQFWRRPQQ